jgi:hypothetical protein
MVPPANLIHAGNVEHDNTGFVTGPCADTVTPQNGTALGVDDNGSLQRCTTLS